MAKVKLETPRTIETDEEIENSLDEYIVFKNLNKTNINKSDNEKLDGEGEGGFNLDFNLFSNKNNERNKSKTLKNFEKSLKSHVYSVKIKIYIE